VSALELSAPPPPVLLEPLRQAPRTMRERFDLEQEAQLATGNFFSRDLNHYRAFAEAAEAFAQQGVRLANPLAMAGPTARQAALAEWDEAARRLQEQNPDARDTYPTAHEIMLRADLAAAQRLREARAAEDSGGGFGAFLGSMAGIFQDPVQLATLPFGAPWRAGVPLLTEIGRVALIEGGVAGATQAAVELRADPYRRELGFQSEAATQILAAMAGGAVLGGGLRGLVGALEVRAARRAGAEATPADVLAADARALAEARLAEEAGNPAGPEAMRLHQAAMDRATAETAAGLATGARLPPAAAPESVPGAARGFVERMLAEGAAGGRAASGPEARFYAFTPAGRAVLVEPQVVELRTLVPSHLDDGTPNPAYPHAEGVQPRDRGAAPSQDQVRAIAAGLIPERLAPNVEAGFGAPIVAEDLVVESGNGRVGALRRAYSDPALREVAEAYRAFLRAQGHDIAGMDQPVLVSRRVSALSPEERRAFVAEANGRATLAQTVAERARGDAAKLDEALPLFRGGDVDSADNAPFVRAFLGRLTPEERGSLITKDGRLSAEGASRLRAAVLARAYGDEMGPLLDRFLEGQTDGLRAIAGALTDVSARWAQLRQAVRAGEVDPGMDATADLIGALRTLDEARRQKIPVAELLLQTDLDRPPLTDAGRAFLAGFFDGPNLSGRTPSRERLAARLDAFIDQAMQARPGLDMFGAPPVRPADILEGNRLREAPASPPRAETSPTAAEPPPPLDFGDEAQALLAARRTATRPVAEEPPLDPIAMRQQAIREAEAEAAATRPPPEQLAPVEWLEAQRIAAERDIPVPEEAVGPDGAPITRGARELLDEADAQAADARQAALCLIGGAA
jgi:hypothetical protein